MHPNLKKLFSARAWRIAALGVFAVGYSALQAQPGPGVDVFREGSREFYATYKWFTAPELRVNDITIPVGGEGLFPHKGQPAAGPNRYVTFALPAR